MEIDDPVARPLKAYAFDPSAGKLLGNEMALQVRYQELDKGPLVKKRVRDAIAVVDYDAANDCFYKPVDLNDPKILIRGGLDPSEGNPWFHQQMIYAVVSETVQHFATALGRRIHWRRGVAADESDEAKKKAQLDSIYTLNLYPHAFIGKNAFYAPAAKGILFGYFRASAGDAGRNIPGQTVFTCLSHDIVVHETTHAIVDGMRPLFMEQTNPDVPAFHEAFADLAALFRHFTHKEVLLDTIERTGGRLYRYQLKPDAEVSGYDDYTDASEAEKAGVKLSSQISQRNPLIELAQQFGEATGRRRALRSALGTKPNSDDIKKQWEPHTRGSILVAAVFDAFFAMYLKRTADLWRIFRAGGGSNEPVDIPRPLADRLCDDATRLAELFFTICVRALDYTPPVDITFGTYLRAVLTADFDLHPNDESGFRDALLQSFRLRGIYPEGAGFFNESAACWERETELTISGLDFGDSNGLIDEQKDAIGALLRKYVRDNWQPLGFDEPTEKAPILVPSFHPVFRVNPDGSLRTDMVVEAVQTKPRDLIDGQPRLGRFPLRAATALIITKPVAGETGAEKNVAPVRYVIKKAATDDRADQQRRFADYLGISGPESDFRINFSLIHGGF